MARGFPQLARNVGQSGKVPGLGKETRSGAPSCPAAKGGEWWFSLFGQPRVTPGPEGRREAAPSGGKQREDPAQTTPQRAQAACSPPEAAHTQREVGWVNSGIAHL